MRERVEGTLQLPPSQEYLGQEIHNIVEAVNRIADEVIEGGSTPITVGMVREYNRLVLKGLPLPDEVVPGELRKHSVVVGKYLAAPWEDCEELLEKLVAWLNGPGFDVPDSHPDMHLVYGIIKAILAHLYLAWIHPFGDGNGRTSRLLEFELMIAAGVPVPAAHLLSNHYNLTRAEYYRQLDISSKSGGDIIPFLCYAAQGFVDGLREQISHIRIQQMDVAWQNYVYDAFHAAPSATAHRRRALVLELGKRIGPVPKSELRQLSPKVAESYAGKTVKTLSRDLNALRKMGLVEQAPDGWRARTETVLAFLPRKAKQ